MLTHPLPPHPHPPHTPHTHTHPQVGIVKGGGRYVMFGDGNLAACKPISEADLARVRAECVRGEFE